MRCSYSDSLLHSFQTWPIQEKSWQILYLFQTWSPLSSRPIQEEIMKILYFFQTWSPSTFDLHSVHDPQGSSRHIQIGIPASACARSKPTAAVVAHTLRASTAPDIDNDRTPTNDNFNVETFASEKFKQKSETNWTKYSATVWNRSELQSSCISSNFQMFKSKSYYWADISTSSQSENCIFQNAVLQLARSVQILINQIHYSTRGNDCWYSRLLIMQIYADLCR